MSPTDRTSEVILVVDDDCLVREVVKATLVADGYNVMSASDGLEAWDIVQRFPTTIGLVVSDVQMPNLDGLEFCRRVQIALPDMPVVLMSGFLTRPIEQHLGVNVRFLQKPFTSRALLGLVHAALTSSWGTFVARPHAPGG